MRILHVASEVAPYSKTGGLADVLGALPEALARARPRGHRGHAALSLGRSRALRAGAAAARAGGAARGRHRRVSGVYEGQAASAPRMCASTWSITRRRSIATGSTAHAATATIGDNARRFALLGSAALALAADSARGPTSCTATIGRRARRCSTPSGAGAICAPPKTVFTIHNLAFQGLFAEASDRRRSDYRPNYYNPDGYEFYGQVSFLKAGLALADQITTVSPRYAREIQTPEQGFKLNGAERMRAKMSSGSATITTSMNPGGRTTGS